MSRAVRLLPEPSLVGRDGELAQIDRLLDAQISGSGSLLLIGGDHGTGKTRLALEARRRAEARGLLAAWGRGRDDEGMPPYWPWSEILSDVVNRLGLTRARRIAGADEVAALVPALRGKQGASKRVRSPRLVPGARYSLSAAARGFLDEASRGTPLLIVLDDLHYCDSDTLKLLEEVAPAVQSSPLLLVGTWVGFRARRRTAVTSCLAELCKLPRCCELTVSGLTEREALALLCEQARCEPPPDLARSLLRQTRGNPLFVVEIGRQIATSSARQPLAKADWRRHAVDTVGLLTDRRVSRLSEGGARVLEAAAAIGREPDLATLASVLEIGEDEARSSVAEALDEGLLLEERPDRFRFHHELVQRAIMAALSPARRAELHGRAGRALEAARARGEQVEPARLAVHFGRAGTASRSAAARYAREAGLEALAAFAFEKALRHFRQAAGWTDGGSIDQGELALLEARALFCLVRDVEAAECVQHAVDTFLAQRDLARATDAAVFAFFSNRPLLPLGPVREKLLSLVPAGSLEWARLSCELGANFCAPFATAAGYLDQALEAATRLGARRVELRALSHRALLERRNLRYPTYMQTARRALDLAREIGDVDIELEMGGLLGIFALSHGDRASAESILAELRPKAEAEGARIANTEAANLACRLAHWQGRWEQVGPGVPSSVFAWSRRAYELMTEREVCGQPGGELSARVIEAATGGQPVSRRFDTVTGREHLSSGALSLAVMQRVTGDRSGLAMVREMGRTALSMEVPPWTRLQAIVALGVEAWLRGDLDTLASLCGDELAAPADIMLSGGAVLLDHYRGLFAGALGRDREAHRYFESALALCRKAGFYPELGWTCLDYAAFLALRGEHGSACRLVDEGLRAAFRLGMKPLERELLGFRARLQGALPDGLSEREVEVIRLAVTGRSSRQIGETLFISYHTVVNHLRHIYEKTGVHTREALADYAARHMIGTPSYRRSK